MLKLLEQPGFPTTIKGIYEYIEKNIKKIFSFNELLSPIPLTFSTSISFNRKSCSFLTIVLKGSFFQLTSLYHSLIVNLYAKFVTKSFIASK